MKQELLEIVHRIPYGRVSSYGQIAIQLDIHYNIKTSGYIVGKILSAMPESEWVTCPWWRVINKQGYISSLKLGRKGLLQKQLLAKENILIMDDTVDMKAYAHEW